MHSVLSATFPMLALVTAGFLVGRWNIIGSNADEILSRYVFYCSMPAFLFLSLLARDIADALQIDFIICFATSAAISMALSTIMAIRVLRLTKAEVPLFLMNSSYVNSINLGVPLLIYTIGDPLPVVIVNIFQLLIVSPALIFLMEKDDEDETAVGTMRRSTTMLLRNPIIAATALGLLGSITDWQPPVLIENTLGILGQAAVPTALFALGLTLAKVSSQALREITCDLWIALPMKLLIQPMIAGAVGYFIVDLPPQWLIAVILAAGLPAPQNVVILAQKYRAYVQESAGIVFFSSLLSMMTLFAFLQLAGWVNV